MIISSDLVITVFQIHPSACTQHTLPVSPYHNTKAQFITLEHVMLVLVTRDNSQDITAMKTEASKSYFKTALHENNITKSSSQCCLITNKTLKGMMDRPLPACTCFAHVMIINFVYVEDAYKNAHRLHIKCHKFDFNQN